MIPISISYFFTLIKPFYNQFLTPYLPKMIKTQKAPLIQSIVPNAEDYLQQVSEFYHDKIQNLMNKINHFMAIAIQLTEIPQHLQLEFATIRTMPKLTQQERQIEYAMLKQEIEKFLSLKNQVIQSQTGNKYLYPDLPKIQRNLQKRKNSKSDSTSSDSDKNDSSQRKESVNQICDLLGTLTLQNKSEQEICESIQNIVGQLSKLNLNTSSNIDEIQTEQQFKKLTLQSTETTFNKNSVELYEIRRKKKLELLKYQSHFHQNQDNMGSLNFQQTFKQKLLQIKQLFKLHLQKSVQKVTKEIQSILSKALKDIKQNQKVYVPIHKISKNFNQLNLKFYRTEGVIKCLHKYLMKKIKQCIMDGNHTYVINGKQTQIRTNFRLRFFKHILLENIFVNWLEHAISDLNRIIRYDGQLEMIKCQQSHKQSAQSSPEKDRSQKLEHSIDQSMNLFPSLHKGSFDNFIM